jgi:hypothetical protein
VRACAAALPPRRSTVVLKTGGHNLTNNLAAGLFKDMSGKGSFDAELPASFEIQRSDITVVGERWALACVPPRGVRGRLGQRECWRRDWGSALGRR